MIKAYFGTIMGGFEHNRTVAEFLNEAIFALDSCQTLACP